MIRKILLFTLLGFAALPARANDDQFCFSSAKLTQMRNQISALTQDSQHAYNELFQIMVAKNESGTPSNAGCISIADIAQICKNIWENNTEKCENFVYDITTEPAKANFKTLTYTDVMKKTDFSDINPEIFAKAFDKAVARRRYKNIPSKLQNMAPEFLAQAKQNQVNPFLITGITLWESGRGTSSLAREKNNIAALGGPGKWKSFSSVPDCIAYLANLMHDYIQNGKTTLTTIGASYCPGCTTWPSNIGTVSKEVYRFYNTFLQESK